MQGDVALALIRLFVLLVAASVLVALVARRVAMPYTVALVIAGLIAGIADPLAVQVSPSLVLVVLLPGLIFEAAYHIEPEELRPSLGPVVLLAGPGVLVVAVLVAATLHMAAGLTPGGAFVVGAMVAATDPAAVIASFRRLRAPRRLAALVEAESLFNDGTGIVIFVIAVGAATTPVGPGQALLSFVGTIVFSGAIGLAAGFIASRLMVMAGDHLVELAMSLVLAYGTYLLADAIHESGVIATAFAAVVLRSYGHRIGISDRTRLALDEVWEFVAFLSTALIFLLVGLAIPLSRLVDAAGPILWAIVAVLVARVLIVYVMLGVWRWLAGLRRAERPAGDLAPQRSPPPVSTVGNPIESPTTQARAGLPIGWLHVIAWSGLRGAVSVALALALPVDFPDRTLLQGITFGVVLFTLLVQATTADLVIRAAGVVADEAPIEAEQLA